MDRDHDFDQTIDTLATTVSLIDGVLYVHSKRIVSTEASVSQTIATAIKLSDGQRHPVLLTIPSSIDSPITGGREWYWAPRGTLTKKPTSLAVNPQLGSNCHKSAQPIRPTGFGRGPNNGNQKNPPAAGPF